MAKKKQKVVLPAKKLLVVAAVVVAIGLVFGVVKLQHHLAVNKDKARFTQAQQDVETVAGQIVAAVGQPQDRKDGGKCSYAHQEFSKGPLSCEVYSYLAYGIGGSTPASNLGNQISSIMRNTKTPWLFKEVTEKPENSSSATLTFITPQTLSGWNEYFEDYTNSSKMNCGIGYRYYNSLFSQGGYPQFNVSSPQTLLVSIVCNSIAKSAVYPLSD